MREFVATYGTGTAILFMALMIVREIFSFIRSILKTLLAYKKEKGEKKSLMKIIAKDSEGQQTKKTGLSQEGRVLNKFIDYIEKVLTGMISSVIDSLKEVYSKQGLIYAKACSTHDKLERVFAGINETQEFINLAEKQTIERIGKVETRISVLNERLNKLKCAAKEEFINDGS